MTIASLPGARPIDGHPGVWEVSDSPDARAVLAVGDWPIAAAVYDPRLLVVGSPPEAVAQLTRRPSTSTLKIARARTRGRSAAAALLNAVHAHAQAGGFVSVKLQDPPAEVVEVAIAAWFQELSPPIEPGPGPVVARGFVGYLSDAVAEAREAFASVPYYRQTTDVTCGPVALLMAGQGEATRAGELALWRRATNLPGCDPISLAAAVESEAHPEVHLSVDGPVLLEHSRDEHDRSLRVELQREAEARARSAGTEIRRELISIDDVLCRVSGGRVAVALIDELLLHDEACPHWIVVHAVVDGIAIVNDPWTDVEGGESWVDGVDLALTRDQLDAITWWGEPAYRGILLIDRA